jgi:hypothetical protein
MMPDLALELGESFLLGWSGFRRGQRVVME